MRFHHQRDGHNQSYALVRYNIRTYESAGVVEVVTAEDLNKSSRARRPFIL